LPFGRQIWRGLVGVVGLAVIVVGVILLPLPGPGWLIIFVGLAIWGTEFTWARRLLTFARAQVARWTEWLRRQSRWVQVLCAVLSMVFLAGVLLGSWWLTRRI
jgi:uncharacterized protein (TIGR02611 family)